MTAEFLSCVYCRKGSRRSDEEALEEQVKKMGEELREVKELYAAEQDKTHNSKEELLRMHNQVRVESRVHYLCTVMYNTVQTC